MNLAMWAIRWGVSVAAINDLKQQLGTLPQDGNITPDNPLSEAAVINIIKLEASQKGVRLWRNNVGATYMQDGSFLRFGLANESRAINKVIKSADLIGIRPTTVTPEMIGYTIGQFVSREVKSPAWKYSGTDHEIAQLNWAETILMLGGDASFATGEGTL